jgi:hypothetical protein
MSSETRYFLRIEKITKGKIEGYELWDEIPLKKDKLVIGRPSNNTDIISPDIKIIGDDSVTRGDHVTISFSPEENCFMVSDRHSSFGTSINDQQIGKNINYPLKDNSTIGLSKNRILFRFRDSCSSLPPENIIEYCEKSVKPDLYVNLKAKEVCLGGVKIPLTKNELKVLEYLYLNLEKACSVESIANYVWGDKIERIDLVTQYIRRLRKKIEQTPSEPHYILTVPGRHGCYLLSF